MKSELVQITLPLTQEGLIGAALLLVLSGVVALALFGDGLKSKDDSMMRALKAFGWVYGVVWLFVFLGTLQTLWFVFTGTGPEGHGEDMRSLGMGALIAALLGAPFVIWGTVLKHQTVMFQKEGHMTDRINKAVEQLGAEKTIKFEARYIQYTRSSSADWIHETRVKKDQKIDLPDDVERIDAKSWHTVEETVPNIEVRVGAILSLERVAQDSTRHDNGRDHVRVMEILCSYIRENAPSADLTPSETPFQKKRPRIDIQTALSVVKRRSAEQVEIEANEKYRLDLRETCLDGADLSNGNLSGAMIWRSRLEAVNFSRTDLTATQFQNSLLNFSIFYGSILQGTVFDGINLSETNFGSFSHASVKGVFMEGADMRAWVFRKNNGILETFGSRDTIVADRYADLKEKGLEAADWLSILDPSESDFFVKIKEYEDVPFSHWNPYDRIENGAAPPLRTAFRKSRGHIGWPFED